MTASSRIGRATVLPLAATLHLAMPVAATADQGRDSAPASASRQAPNCPFGGHAALKGGALGRLGDLELSGEQRGAIQAIFERYRTRGFDLAQRGRGIREQFMAVTPQDPQYQDATRQAGDAAATLAADTVALLAELRSDIDAVLTDAQRTTLREHWRREQERWSAWREQHRGTP